MSEYEDYNSYLQQEHLVKQTTSKPTEIDKLKIEIKRLNNIITKLENYIENDIKELDIKRLNAKNTTSITYYDEELKCRRYLNKLKELKENSK